MRKSGLKKATAFDVINITGMAIICLVMLYPVWYVMINSLSSAGVVMKERVLLWPKEFTLESYAAVFKNADIFSAFEVTILKTIIGTIVSVLFTAMVAYGLSKPTLPGRKLFMGMGMVTMFFSGGLIPYFLVIKNLGMLDRFSVYIIPAMFSFYNAIIFITFFRQIPKELDESAKMDGANDMRIFWSIILPVSMPVLATIALFNGVAQWNDYFTGVIFVTKNQWLIPIQTFLYKAVAENTSNAILAKMPASVRSSMVSSTTVKFATMVITTAPIVVIYPFLQKYFVKGVMIGSVKG